MRFQEICAGNDLTRAMAAEVVKKSPLLAEYVEFFKKPGSSVTYRTDGGASLAGATRALGSKYTPTEMKPSYGTAMRKMLGDTARLDVAYERMGYDIPSEMRAQLIRHMGYFGRRFNYALIKGDPDTTATEFAGLEKLVSDDRVVSMGDNGAQVTLGNSDTAKKAQQAFLEKVNETVDLCEGTNKVIITSAAVQSRLTSIANECITVERNEFGVPVKLFNMVPIINIGDAVILDDDNKPVYKPILDKDEKVGTSTDCTSLYVVSFEEEDGLSFATCDGGFTVYDMQKVDNFYECMYELIADSALVRASALSKLEGIRL